MEIKTPVMVGQYAMTDRWEFYIEDASGTTIAERAIKSHADAIALAINKAGMAEDGVGVLRLCVDALKANIWHMENSLKGVAGHTRKVVEVAENWLTAYDALEELSHD